MRTYLIAATVITLAVSCSPPGSSPPSPGPDLASRGRPNGAELFRVNCSVCHGEKGLGDGLAARFLLPKPRDFTQGKYKLRSTATGEVPTDSDLMRTLKKGIPGTAMPSYGHLSESDRVALVAHLKSLAVREVNGRPSNIFAEHPSPVPVTVGAVPPVTPELVKTGAGVYRKMGCAKCHGDSGIGDGSSAATLQDDWGNPVPPNNFTRGLYKGGPDPRDIYLRFTTGMSGTPMPSFATELSDAERWALVYYVKSLERPERKSIPAQKSEIRIAGRKVARVPVQPFDPIWKDAPATDLPLMLLWQRGEAPEVLTVRAVHDGETLALLLDWPDATVNATTLRPQDFTDAAAVMFAMSDPPGHFTMGEKGKPCNLWHWRMDRQLDLAKFQDTEDQYPNMAADDYPLAQGPKVHKPIPPAASHDPDFLTGKAAGNPASQTERTTCIEDLNSVGFGTLEPQPKDQQSVLGRGDWANGRWRVIFIRKLSTGEAKDAPLKAGKPVQVSFAVWDGAAKDRNGQKSVTFWQILELE